MARKKKLIIKHHQDDYECMWNGIEDLYMNKTGEILPPSAFFSLSSFGSFCYLKTEKSDIKRMIAFGDGRTKKMYEFLAPIVGFQYRHYEYKTFKSLMKKLRAEIDSGFPVIIGALDMFYLSYFSKMYHRDHIPFHYVMVTGYDDDLEQITLLDCGRKEEQHLSYEDLKPALDCSYPGLSKPNTLCSIRMSNPKPYSEIIKQALEIRARNYLNSPISILGHDGFMEFIDEFPTLIDKLGRGEFAKILYNFVQFLGIAPTIPNKLLGIEREDEITFYGGFDKISRVLRDAGNRLERSNYKDASEKFSEGNKKCNLLKTLIVNYLVDDEDNIDQMIDTFKEIEKIINDGFEILISKN